MRKWTVILSASVMMVALLYAAYSYKSHYTSTAEEAALKANIPFDDIYAMTETKDRVLILYGEKENEVLSVGLLKKNWLGYQWIMGSGVGGHTEAITPPVHLAIANLPLDNPGTSNEYVSVAYGSIVTEQIAHLHVQFDGEPLRTAEVTDTSMGRKWYALSDNPIQKDPQVIATNKEGTEIYTNYGDEERK